MMINLGDFGTEDVRVPQGLKVVRIGIDGTTNVLTPYLNAGERLILRLVGVNTTPQYPTINGAGVGDVQEHEVLMHEVIGLGDGTVVLHAI